MPPASSESQFTFLISCIRYSNNGKVDFTEVAKECGIVSKGAAAKRYERMMKAHGIYQGSQPIRETTIASRPSKRAEAGSTSKNKKRKLDQFQDTNSTTDTGDDDEDIPDIKPEPIKSESIKPEPTENGAVVKEEPNTLYENPTCYSHGAIRREHQLDDGNFFNDFLHQSAFDQSSSTEQPAYSASLGTEVFPGFEAVPNRSSGKGEAIHDTIVIAD